MKKTFSFWTFSVFLFAFSITSYGQVITFSKQFDRIPSSDDAISLLLRSLLNNYTSPADSVKIVFNEKGISNANFEATGKYFESFLKITFSLSINEEKLEIKNLIINKFINERDSNIAFLVKEANQILSEISFCVCPAAGINILPIPNSEENSEGTVDINENLELHENSSTMFNILDLAKSIISTPDTSIQK